MHISAHAEAFIKNHFPQNSALLTLAQSDPEFAAIMANFAFDEVANYGGLSERFRFMAVLSCLIGSQSLEVFALMVPAALKGALSPEEIKEISYQAAAYLGFGRAFSFVQRLSQIYSELGIVQPLPIQAKVPDHNRLEQGLAAQVSIFGEGMRDFVSSAPAETRHINTWLADNCFGDYYTRGGLDFRDREILTFCFIAAQGGCEPQLCAHISANLKVGNDKAMLIDIISHILPYIGYPRSLNALNCLKKICTE